MLCVVFIYWKWISSFSVGVLLNPWTVLPWGIEGTKALCDILCQICYDCMRSKREIVIYAVLYL